MSEGASKGMVLIGAILIIVSFIGIIFVCLTAEPNTRDIYDVEEIKAIEGSSESYVIVSQNGTHVYSAVLTIEQKDNVTTITTEPIPNSLIALLVLLIVGVAMALIGVATIQN